MTHDTITSIHTTDSAIEQVAAQLFERRFEVEGTPLRYSWTDAKAENVKLGWSIFEVGPVGHAAIYSAHVMLDEPSLRAAYKRSDRMLRGEC